MANPDPFPGQQQGLSSAGSPLAVLPPGGSCLGCLAKWFPYQIINWCNLLMRFTMYFVGHLGKRWFARMTVTCHCLLSLVMIKYGLITGRGMTQRGYTELGLELMGLSTTSRSCSSLENLCLFEEDGNSRSVLGGVADQTLLWARQGPRAELGEQKRCWDADWPQDSMTWLQAERMPHPPQ